MADLVTLTIDGVEVTVPTGTLVVDAAKRVDIDIPVFCYHPKMEPVGMCRMCLVEIGLPMRDRETGEVVLDEDGQPKINFGRGLQTGCTVPVSEGMVVRTTTDEVEDARDDILEFLLTSHPLDCPICDKGGECPLQNLTMRHGPGQSRMNYANKMKLAKHVPLGDLIFLDRERCIQCARCTRYQDELVDDPVIAFHNRGRRLEIVTNSDPGFDSIWSGNTTDICPVGALTTADFRFGARPWELTPVASVCTHCPVGCNTTLSTRREAKTGGRNVIKRIMPRQNEMVNEIWICDKGRFVHHYADHPDRLTQPLVRENGELRPATWDEALDKVADGLQAHKEAVAGLSGDRLSNEDLFLFQKLFRDGLESPHLALANPKLGGADVVARVGLTSGSNLQEMGAGDAIVVVASDLHQEAPVWWFRIKQATERGAALVVLNARPTRLDKFAAHTIYYEPGQALETAHQLLNAAKVALNGDEDDPLQAASSALFKAENLVAFYGSEGLAYQETEALARTLANLLLLKDDEGRNHVGRPNNGLVPVWAHNNTQGAWDMGVRPDAGPGYQPLPETGLDAGAIYDGAASGDVRALYVMGVDPVGDGLMRGRGELDFVVVQELFLTETARLADVVLPAQSWAERDGTFTSGERRVQRFYPAIPAVGDSRPDWQIVAQVAERLGLGKPPYAAGLIFRDIAQTVPQYEGLTYRVLAEAVEQWPRVGGDDLYFAGTSYDNKSGVGRQWPSVAEAEEALELYDLPPVRSAAAEDDGVKVIAASALYRQGSLINRSEVLASRIVPPTLVLHHEDAAQLDVSQDDVANVTLDSAEYRLRVRVDNSVTRPGLGLVQGVTLPPRRTVLQLNGVEKTQQTEEIALV
ncbi:MAG: NADH-quinone oxidoreductase subunit NuoG [Chloroflexota bacterium]